MHFDLFQGLPKRLHQMEAIGNVPMHEKEDEDDEEDQPVIMDLKQLKQQKQHKNKMLKMPLPS